MEIDIFGVPVDLGADRRGVEMVEVNPILDV
jgi:arginase family enzyme